MPAARIRQPEQLCDFVEGFPGSVVARRAEEAILPPCFDVEKHCVSAGNEQSGKRGSRVRMLERCCEEVTFHVMDWNHRNSPRKRERLRVTNADQQRADQSRRVGDCDRIDSCEISSRIIQRTRDDGYDAREVRARAA